MASRIKFFPLCMNYILRRARRPEALKFFQQHGLQRFVELDWQAVPDAEDAAEFVANFNLERTETIVRGERLSLGDECIKDVFQLPVGIYSMPHQADVRPYRFGNSSVKRFPSASGLDEAPAGARSTIAMSPEAELLRPRPLASRGRLSVEDFLLVEARKCAASGSRYLNDFYKTIHLERYPVCFREHIRDLFKVQSRVHATNASHFHDFWIRARNSENWLDRIRFLAYLFVLTMRIEDIPQYFVEWIEGYPRNHNWLAAQQHFLYKELLRTQTRPSLPSTAGPHIALILKHYRNRRPRVVPSRMTLPMGIESRDHKPTVATSPNQIFWMGWWYLRWKRA